MVATITSALSRLGGLMVTSLMLVVLLSFVCNPNALLRQVAQRSLPVPSVSGHRAPVVEPDPRANNVVRGLTDEVTIETPVPASHAGHQH